jgi:hypothetical protein
MIIDVVRALARMAAREDHAREKERELGDWRKKPRKRILKAPTE